MKAASRPLLVGLDNPHSNDPRMALYPTPNTTGARLVDLIGETVHNYSRQEYLRDFSRTNMYPTKRAVIGAGSVRADREAFSHVEHLVQMLDVNDVVLLGNRNVRAFNGLHGRELDWLECEVITDTGDNVRRYWALPHPSGRNHWYNLTRNSRAASDLLGRLINYAAAEVMP